jgi:hypothetical protein
VITARYAGSCHDCGQGFPAGAQIQRVENTYAIAYRHAICPDDPDLVADRAALAKPRCRRCTTNHAGEC